MKSLFALIQRILNKPAPPPEGAREVNLLSFHEPHEETYDNAVDRAIAFLKRQGGGKILVPPGNFQLNRAHPLPPGVEFKAWKPGGR